MRGRYAFTSKVVAVRKRSTASRFRASDTRFEQEVVRFDVSPQRILEWAFTFRSIYSWALFEIVSARASPYARFASDIRLYIISN